MTSYEYEHTVETAAPPAAVWRLWSEVGRWPEWDASVQSVELRGPFEVGTTGTMHITGQPPIPFRLTEVEPGRGFVDETEIPGGVLRFRHTAVALPGGGTAITHRVEIDGAEDVAAEFGPQVTEDVPESVAALAALAALVGSGDAASSTA